MTRELNKDATSRVKCCGETSDSFSVTQGVHKYSCQNRYDLQASKSVVLDYNKSSTEDTTWSVRKQPIPTPAFAQHLGLVRDRD